MTRVFYRNSEFFEVVTIASCETQDAISGFYLWEQMRVWVDESQFCPQKIE